MPETVNQRLIRYAFCAQGDLTNMLINAQGWKHERTPDIERCLAHVDFLVGMLLADRDREEKGRR